MRSCGASALILAGCLWTGVNAGAADDQLARRGEYILRAAGCVACHTDVDNDGAFLAGGRRLETPFGIFYSPNITPDPEYGIGKWVEADLVAALAQGLAPDGSDYYPVFPYPSYTRMRREDMQALWAHLRTVEPVAMRNRPHELPWYLDWRAVNRAWKWMNFDPGPMGERADRDAVWNRGAYLAEALGHCGECHTPRGWSGAPDPKMHLAGTAEGAEGEAIPNITPDTQTGIGRWTHDDLVYFLDTGGTPGGDYTGSLMAEVVDESTRHLSGADREALATYLRSLPAIANAAGRPAKKTQRQRGEFE